MTRSEEIREINKCFHDPFYFMRQLKIRTVKYGMVSFDLYEFQKQFCQSVFRNTYLVSLKPRQMGITTVMCGLALWYATFYPGSVIIVISLKHSVSKGFIRKMRAMYASLPEYLKPRIINGTKADSFGTQDFVHFANNSEIHALPSTEEDV